MSLSHSKYINLEIEWDISSINSFIEKLENKEDESLESLINDTKNINMEEETSIEERCTPLYYCVDQGYLEHVKSLLCYGADPNAIGRRCVGGRISPLNQAIYKYNLESNKNYFEIIKILIENNADVNFQADNGQTPLLLIASIGDIKLFKLLVAAGASINICYNDGTTPLLQAIKSKQYHMLEFLLLKEFNSKEKEEEVMDVNKRDIKGRTPLLQIIETYVHKNVDPNFNVDFDDDDDDDDKLTKGVRLLIENGAEVRDERNKGGIMYMYLTPTIIQTPLLCACKIGRLDIVNILIAAGALDQPDKNRINSLITATDKGYYTIVRRLLEVFEGNQNDKNYINYFDIHLDTALHHVCSMYADANDTDDIIQINQNKNKRIEERDYYKTIQILIDSNLDVNKCNSKNEIALHIALDRNLNDEIVQLLVEAGSDIEARNILNHNALDIASLKCRSSIVELLLSKGANINQRNSDAETPLYHSCYADNLKTSMTLIVAGADPKISNVNGCTPLYWACWNGNHNLTKALIVAGADVNQATNMNVTPVSVACNMGHTKVLKLLIENNADINKADNDLRSPLLKACFQGHKEIVSILIEGNANLSFKSENHVTPFGIACRRGHIEIIKLLLNSGVDANTGLKDAFLRNDLEVFRVLLAAGVDSIQCKKMILAKTDKKILDLLKWYRYRSLLLMRVKTIQDCTSGSPTPAEIKPTKIGSLLTDKCTDEAKEFRRKIASYL